MDSASWQKAKDLIVDALELPAGEREDFVRQRCADPAICAEIFEMLDGVRTRDEFLASRQISAAAGRLVDDEDDALQIGTKVGPYLVVDRIGRGGMGQVFLGTDPRLERRVALKCLLDAHATGAGVRSGILHEARAAARISNQHIAAVYDVIEHDSRAFIVMEYVEGESLAVRLRRGRLSVEQTLTFGHQLVLALTAAHAQNIVHRDLKPGNIQVTPAGAVKVLDFGIAHATRRLTTAPSSAATTNPAIEAPQAVPFAQPGTPPYMSPEQLLGRHVDERSDIFSLGVVLFEMCTGQRPYPGNNAAAIAAAQMKGVARADAICPDVPPQLADLVNRALAIDVRKRYQTADEVGQALEEVRKAIETRPPVSWRELIRRWIPRVAIGTPVGLLGLGALGFLTSVQFNFVFGLDGEFARFGVEPWRNYFQYGLLATAPMLVPTVLVGVPFVGVRFVLGLLTLISPIGRFARRIRAGAERAEAAMGLDKSATLAQALMVLGVVSLALFVWAHADLIRAWSSFFNSAPIEQLMPMTDSAPERNRYHNELSIATLALSFGLYRVIVVRRRETVRDGRFGVAMLATVIAVMVLLNVLPWRTFHRRDFERLDTAGAHCYITGESGDELMVLCPGGDPPRNRVVRKDAVVESVQSERDPLWHRPGRKENVFKGIPYGFAR